MLSFFRAPQLSAPAYFAFVGAATLLIFGLNDSFRSNMTRTAQEVLGLTQPLKVAPDSFYAVRVAPLFEDHCIACHGERRQKGKLRLDSFTAVIRGARSGSVVDVSHGQSELVHRITLPTSNDKAMPPEGKTPLAASEVTVIKLWIAAGASGLQPVTAFKNAPKPVIKIKFAEIDEAAVKRERAALAATVAQLQTQFPGAIEYESRGSADFYVNTLNNAAFGDRELKALMPLGERIVWADFSNTGIGDASIPALKTMRRLRSLRLTHTQVTDAALEALLSLKELQSISVVGTAVTERFVSALRNKGVKVYDGKA